MTMTSSRLAGTILRALSPLLLTALLLAAPASGDAGAPTKPPYSPEYEKRVGAEAVAEVEKEYKLLDDPATKAKLSEMVAKLAAVSQRPDVVYDVRLLDTDQVNAFSLPGGTIYVTKGLLAEVQSDHELAGVLAHEIAHNCTWDALVQADRNKHLFRGSVAATIAAILLGGSSDVVSTVLMAGEYVRQGVLGGYSIDLERQADRNGASYLIACPDYDPAGIVTFMERLAAKERREPPRELGVFQTHPLATERVRLLIDFLIEQGVEINRRAAIKWLPPSAEEVEVDGQPAAVIKLWEEELFVVRVPAPGYDTPLARAQAIVQRLTELLAAGLSNYEVQVAPTSEGVSVIGRGQVILTVLPEDAQAAQTDAATLAARVRDALSRAFVRESLDRLY